MVIVVFVALIPLVISTLTAVGLHRRAFDGQVRELHQKTATFSASGSAADLEAVVENLDLLVTRTIDWNRLTPEEREGAVWLVYRQLDDLAIATLLDSRGDGKATAYLGDAESAPDLASHPIVSLGVLAAFGPKIPFEAARERGVAVGEPFTHPDLGSPILPLAFRIGGPESAKDGFVVATGLSLRAVCAGLERARTTGTDLYLLDHDRTLCSPAGRPSFDGSVPAAGVPAVLSRTDARGVERIAAVAPLGAGSPGWRVVVEQPTDEAFAASRRMRNQSLLWVAVSLLAAISAGIYLGREITGPIEQLVRGASELEKGNFGYRLPPLGRDEFGRLSTAFNDMGAEIERRDGEIRTWNEELQKRVEERTRELKEAQDQILQSQKMSAMSALGAGVAHEINNPLASVLSIGELLRRSGRKEDEAKFDILRKEGQRIKEIVQTLLNLAETSKGSETFQVDLSEVLESALQAVAGRFEERKIEIVRRHPDSAATVLGRRGDLQQMLLHLLENAYIAMKHGGRLVVATEIIDGKLVKVSVEDSGKGIPPENLEKVFEPFFTTKDEWNSKGLGLTVAYRIVQEHHGTIKVASKVGAGTTVTFTLPVSRKGSILS